MKDNCEVRMMAANPLALLQTLEASDASVRLASDLKHAMEPFVSGCQATSVLCSLNESGDIDTWEFEVE